MLLKSWRPTNEEERKEEGGGRKGSRGGGGKKMERAASRGEERLKFQMKESLMAAVSTSPDWLCLGRASASVCVCTSACMHRSAAAKQRLLYIKAGSWLCPEVSVISLSVPHTLAHKCAMQTHTHTHTCRHTSTQAGANTELWGLGNHTESLSKERVSVRPQNTLPHSTSH